MIRHQEFALLVSLVLLLLSSSALAFQQTRSSAPHRQQQQHRLQATFTPQEEESNDISNINNNNNPLLQSRRNILSLVSNLSLLTVCTSNANADVIRSAGCANGEGDACADLAEGNEFIQSLQKKSAENKEANQRVREKRKKFAY